MGRRIGAVLNRSVYELAGGEPAFRLLVVRFYARVSQDEVLRLLKAEANLKMRTAYTAIYAAGALD